MYVALTRARRQVFLSYAATRLVFGTRSITTPSPFLDDIDPAYLELEAPSLLEAWPGERSILF
jgi:DNA helicase-2/ATP-dependent DNA helicase PcrA